MPSSSPAASHFQNLARLIDLEAEAEKQEDLQAMQRHDEALASFDKSIALQSWAKAAPSDFVATATAELAGTSGTSAAAMSRSNTGSASNRYLSKYSVLVTPERSTNSPVMCDVV